MANLSNRELVIENRKQEFHLKLIQRNSDSHSIALNNS
jgi:hypothetical protein